MNTKLLFATLLFPAALSAQHGAVSQQPPRVYVTAAIPSADVPKWRGDLQQLIADLERHHPNPYHRTQRAAFAAAVAELNTRIPGLAAHEIVVEFQRLAAMVGDGHTNINLASNAGVDFHQLPVRFGVYPDGLYIEAADAAYREAVGGRVVAIGDVAIDTVWKRLRPLISRDNEQWIAAAAPHLLNLIEVLHSLRLTNTLASARLQVARNGTLSEVSLRPLPETRPRPFGYPYRPQYTTNWVDARGAGANLPLTQRRLNEVHWWEYQPADGVLYIKWDQVQNRSSAQTALATFREAMTFARENAPRIDKVLLDIRNNTGGEGGLLDPILREIVRTREIDEAGKFFVAIGPRTFSAALIMAVQLQRYSQAIFVGEPTGGKPNVYAGHVFATLHNSGVGVSISPSLYQTAMPHDVREFVAPRLFVQPTFADYVANRDPVYSAVLAYRDPILGVEVERLIAGGDTAGAEGLVQSYSQNPINRYNSGAAIVNATGYRLLQAGAHNAALQAFRLNVRVHPDYTNGWDSLGEAYMTAGDKANAIKAFEKVLEREPQNARARDFLHRLR